MLPLNASNEMSNIYNLFVVTHISHTGKKIYEDLSMFSISNITNHFEITIALPENEKQ